MKRTVLVKPALTVACALGLVVLPAQAYIAPDSFFDVFLETSQGPPYPPAGQGVLTSLGLPTLPFTQVGQVAMKINNVTPPGATTLVGSDSGGGIGDPGVTSFFDVFMDVPMMPDSFFDIFTELSSAVGMPMPLAGEPTVLWHADSFFDVFLECDVPGHGRQFLQMSFRVPEGQTTRFNPNPTPQYIAPDSFFDIFMSVSSTAGGQINPALPVFRVIMTGSLGWPQPQPTPQNVVKFRQNPDPTIHGLDVLDSWLTNTSPATLLADDFICTRTGPITDIHLFGSWLNDLVDYWPTFWVGIWDDVPRSGNTPSHPGNLLWWQQFSPGQYRASVYQQVPLEHFLDPNTPPRLLGQDHQIWKYDFFPRNPYRQLGSPQLPRVYWLSVVTKTAPGRVFGWKTTRDHFNDYAVYSPTMLNFSGSYPTPLQPWQVIVDHQGRKRELAFMLTTSQTWACNKDFWIPYIYPYGNVRVIVPGPWGIGNNFNGFGGSSGQFSTFEWNWDTAGHTIMDWTGGTFTPGQWVHIGFEGPGIFPPFQNWGWWNPFAMSWAGWIPQVSIGWQPLLQPLPRIGLTNILPIVPGLTNNVFISGLTVEYHTNAVPLDQLTRYGVRSPIRVDSAPIPTPMIPPQQSIQMDMSPPPPEATHAVIIPQINPVNEAGEPNLQMPNVDWAMVPLTETELPTLPPQPELQAPTLAGSEVTLTWTAVPGAVYRVQSQASLSGAGWEDAEGDVIANEATASKAVPVAGDTRFYRVEAVLP